MREEQLYIGGRWVAPRQGGSFESFNPYTQQPWARIPLATQEDVNDAAAAASEAFRQVWRRAPGTQRAAAMLKLADLLDANAARFSMLESMDNGKVIRETRPQMHFAARQLRFFAGYCDKLAGRQIPLDQPDVLDFTVMVPIGVIAMITAWNSPMSLLMNKLAPALAAGNCVVVKPSEHACVTTLEFCRLVEEAGFPPGVFNVVTGAAATGQALVNAPGIGKVSFTGSPAGGREIAAAAGRRLLPVVMELGGKSPNIVFEDADLERAVVGALAGIFGATGQTCIAGSRLLVQRSVQQRVVDELAQRAQRIRLGDPTDPATEMGTVANEPQFRKILERIERGKAGGARLVTGGKPAQVAGSARGLFVEPTIFAGVDNGSELAQEEIFGPVLAVIPFDTEEDAIRIANDTVYGLAAGVWTRDLSRALRVAREVESGVLWVNTYRAIAAQAPFGGVKQSGFGRERGEEALREFLACRNIMIDYSTGARDPFAIRT